MTFSTKLDTNSAIPLQPSSILEFQNRASVYGGYETTPRPHNASFDGIYQSVVQMQSSAFLSGAQVRAYIKMVLDDDNFIAEPKIYIANWEVRRTEQLNQGRHCYPQHLALEFFIKNKELL